MVKEAVWCKTTRTTVTARLSLLSLLSFIALGAQAGTVRSWSEVSGDVVNKQYTVPADTTVEVAAGDIAEVNALNKVIFTDSGSVMRIHGSVFPDNIMFQGPGSIVAQDRIVATKQYTYLRRSVGNATDFVKFVFKDGIDYGYDSPETKINFRAAQIPFTNAVVFLDGPLGTNITHFDMRDARYDLGANFSISNNWNTPNAVLGVWGVLRQRGCNIVQPAVNGDGPSMSSESTIGAYLLESGSYITENAGKYLCFYGHYSHVRQTGGLFDIGRFALSAATAGVSIRPDFVFGGTGVVTIRGKSCPSRAALYAFADSVDFSHPYSTNHEFYNFSGGKNGGNCEGTIWAHNGGVACYAFYPFWNTDTGNKTSGPTNHVFAFNGGFRGFRSSYASDVSQTKLSLFGFSPWVRFYENGGGFQITRNVSYTFSGIDFLEPEGNVVKSIELSDELRNKVFQYPPSVEIWDEDGTGTNAAAVVDYDFDTGLVTNISVMCKGENYSANTKANLRYVAGEANRLLSTPLDCTVGPEQGGDIAFASTNLGAEVALTQSTNYMHGALVVDMDRLGVADHGANANGFGNFLHLHYINNGTAARAEQAVKNAYFPNITNIVLKSGGLDCYNNEGGWGYNHTHNPCGILPNCWKLEIYGGHLTGGSARFEEVTIGGEVWLRNHSASDTRIGDIRICRTRASNDDYQDFPGMLTVDVACLTNGITPKVKHGNIRFYCGNANTTLPALAGSTNSAVTVKNWQCIPKSRAWTTILDLTETTVNVPSNSTVPTPLGHRVNVPDIVYPEGSDELRMKWEMNPGDPTKPYRLLARRVADGTILIFR